MFNTACWVNLPADDTLKYFFSYFSQKLGFVRGDDLHEMSKPIFWEKKREKYQFVTSWINPENDKG